MTKKKPSTFEALLGPILLSKIGEYIEKPNFRNFKQSFFHHGPSLDTNEALEGMDFVLLYFSAAWCPPCQKFTPLLKEFYEICKNKDNESKLNGLQVEIVYISSDRDLDEFQAYYGKMPWFALESQHHKTLVSHKCKIAGIPSLIVLNGKGKFVTDTARNDVLATSGSVDKVGEVLQQWKSVEAVPLEEAKFTNSGGDCLIL